MAEDSKSITKKLGVRERRRRFVKEYLQDKNATRAAIAAGYSKKTAHVLGCRLLKDPNVRSQIESSLENVNAKLDISIERVTQELARLAFFDPTVLFNSDGTMKPLHEIPEDALRAIAGLEIAELFKGSGADRGMVGYIKKVKLSEKCKALELLGRHLGMFLTKPLDVNIRIPLADVIAKARKRVMG